MKGEVATFFPFLLPKSLQNALHLFLDLRSGNSGSGSFLLGIPVESEIPGDTTIEVIRN